MTDVAWPKGALSDWPTLVDRLKVDLRFSELFDMSLEPEVQTDKKLVKVLPCQFCQRPLIVTTFYVLAWAKCSPCKGEESGHTRARGSVDVAQAGRTEPSLVKDLTKVLINPAFARASCPVHPDDEDHVMELKAVSHNPHYGPGRRDAKGNWIQIAPGETVMHQCKRCNAVVSYTTTAVIQFKRINEAREGGNANQWATMLGTREEVPVDEDRSDP